MPTAKRGEPTGRSTTTSSAVKELTSRDELRQFIVSEIPGWDNWLTVSAAQIRMRCQDEFLLRSERDILAEIAEQVDQIADSLDERVDAYFLPCAQLRPSFSPNYAVLEPSRVATLAERAKHRALGGPPTWEQLTRSLTRDGVRPAVNLINLLGALAVVRRRRRPGRPKNFRFDLALDYVARDLAPYVTTKSARDQSAEAPDDEDYLDITDEATKPTPVTPPDHANVAGLVDADFRQEPISFRSCALVALYLSLPARQDPEYDYANADPAKHAFTETQLKDAEKALRRRLNEHVLASRLRKNANRFFPNFRSGRESP